MRNLISYFIKYSVAVNVLMAAILIFGVVGLLRMKSSFFPLNETRTISISITYPGASPLEVEEGIMLKIEDNLKGVIGIDRVTSVSRENSGTITVETEKGRDIDLMLQEVKNAVDRVPSYPSGMEPLVVAKQERVRPSISFALTGDQIPLKTLKDVGREIENDLRGIEGISQVELSGFPNEEIEIALRESDLQAYNLTFSQVAETISQENILVTGGNIKTDIEEYLIRANTRSYVARELDYLVVRADASGNVIRLRDIAEVRDRFAESPNATYFNGKVAVNVSISNTNDEDLLSTAANVKEYIEGFNQRYSNLKIDIVSDGSIRLKQRTQLLIENAGVGALLVLFFLSLFLNTRLAFWVAIGLPIAFLGMFIFAPYLSLTINILSLFGMIIVIGILVDDGIVIAENIYAHYEQGKGRIQAAIDGTMEVVPPIVSAILTTLLAFSTFLFLDGRIGEFFSEVAVVVMITLAVSLVEALIILPAHVAHSKALQKEEPKAKKSIVGKIFSKLREVNKIGDYITNILRDKIYAKVLRFALNNRFLTVAFAFSLLIVTVGNIGGGVIKRSFFPSVASDEVSIELNMPEGTNVRITDSILTVLEEKTWLVNEEFTAKQTGNRQVVENVIKRVSGTSSGSLRINLLPGELRDFNSDEIGNAIRQKMGPVYGVESLVYGGGRNFGGSPVSVSLLSNNIEELKAAKQELKEELSNNALLKDITDNDPQGIKEISIRLKEKAYLLGLSTREVMNQVRYGFFGFQAQRFQRGQDEIRVWVRYDRVNRSSINNLDEMKISAPDGSRIPFAEIANYTIERGEIAINHLDGRREIQVSADLADIDASAPEILADIENVIMPEIQSKYPSVSAIFDGQQREQNKMTRSANTVIPIIIFLIYITIAFTFRSYDQPLLLLLLVPMSLVGVAWGHYLHGFSINLLSWLGIIALVGIMVNDGLVLIGKFNGCLKDGMPFDEALFTASKARFRAIFLTSLTTIAGMAPLILEKSRQAQFLIPMAISIAYGIAVATVLTLILLPVYLSLSNSFKVNSKWLFTGKRVPKEQVENAILELKTELHD
ncbi:multidrug efflux pump subunit AcrB [Roseivirga pacifica]|uniref:Multidrug efflux pump subunit AcrB n=1 Tax=Roseivirga pacifica TaxID=1267423 RepID=A0A1I0QIK7_9BACT|nr:efflux RND transporter permease subunit [Roseivirga pacifica]MCO6360850.1 MMPL family transporter [Roseivirga pacifica]MCO6368739.1 MMPL family transporter [Roseivirga pacifica]MCO6372882.1 MMPL family transporter [Roseivirga pacifica]MCO6376941.1 MMPL family transporter [Roseivirga pacifica]MCO6377781.1 MMPL family transporter [Roseivirga pacifica]